MKVHAYTSQHGQKLITAVQAKIKGMSDVYSTHAAGHRFEMFAKRSPNGNHFFSYKRSSSHDGATAPETLSHSLCKAVLAELGQEKISTKLILTYKTKPLPPIDISFLDGSVEKNITIDGQNYFIDCFCIFNQPNNKPYIFSEECKWSGQLAFEVFHTNRLASNDPKCLALKEEGIPIIQIKITDFSDFDESKLDEESDEHIEELILKHKQKLRNAFSKQIYGVLLIDPESIIHSEVVHQKQIYLKNEQKLQDENKQLTSDKNELIIKFTDKSSEIENKLHLTLQENNKLKQENNSLLSKVSTLEETLHEECNKSFWLKFKALFN